MKKNLTLFTLILILGYCGSCSDKTNTLVEKEDPIEEDIIDDEPLSSDKTLYYFKTTDEASYSEIDNQNKVVEIFIPYKSDLELEKLKMDIKISPTATSNIVSGIEYDMTDSFNFVITAEDSTSISYTIIANKCDKDKVAVILSDTQIDIIPLFRQDAFFENVNSVLNKASIGEVPIYYIMLASLKGTGRWDLPSQLIYQEGTIVDKPNTMDAFEVTSFRIELLKAGIGTVYVMGVSSMGCVKGTCEGAISNKFDLYLVSDAHAEPIGYRTEESIDECNEIFKNISEATLILAADVSF
jgi:nicotinamidase-related amidase